MLEVANPKFEANYCSAHASILKLEKGENAILAEADVPCAHQVTYSVAMLPGHKLIAFSNQKLLLEAEDSTTFQFGSSGVGGSNVPPQNGIAELKSGTLTVVPPGFTHRTTVDTASTDVKIRLRWPEGLDEGGPGIQGYEVYRDGAYLATTKRPFYIDSGLLPGSLQTYQIRVRNLFGQFGQALTFEAGTKDKAAAKQPITPAPQAKARPGFEEQCDPTLQNCCDPEFEDCTDPVPIGPLPPLQIFRCTSAVYYRPVDPAFLLSFANHAYWYQTYWEEDINPVTLTRSYYTLYDIVEGLPQNGPHIPFGLLVANIPSSYDGPANLADKDNPTSDPQVGVAFEQGGGDANSACPIWNGVIDEGAELSEIYAYDPVDIAGLNSNYFAWEIMDLVGLSFPAPSNAPGWPGSSLSAPVSPSTPVY